MPQTKTLDQRMNIKTIAWPIFVESLLRMSLMTVDVFMLARYSESAVAAVGLTGNFIFFLVITYMIVSSGSAILIGQNLGAKRQEQAQAFAQAGLFLTVALSAFVSIVFFFGSAAVIGLYQLDSVVEQYANNYLIIVGSLSLGMAISILLSTVLRAHGFSKSPMVIQMISGVINAIGNYFALFPPLGIPQTGVTGVAVSTVVSQVFAALACYWVIKQHRIPFSFRASTRFDGKRLKAILKLGLPNAGEGLSYNVAQIVIMFFVAQLGTAALAAVAIAQTLSRFIFVFSMSLGGGSQILASYLVGQSRNDELKAKVNRYWIAGVAVSLLMAVGMYLGRQPIAAFFTTDVATQLAIGWLLLVSLLLEPGRAINLIVISSLKGTGDVLFPVKIGIVSMWGIGVLFAYIFGIHWAWGVAGIWLAVALDEWTRAIIVIVRWQKGYWRGKAQVEAETEPASVVVNEI